MQKPRDFERRKILTPTLHDMVVGVDKKFSVSEVAVRLWGEFRVEANAQRLYKLLDPNQPDKCLRVDDLAGLIYATGNMAPVHYLCQLFGYAAYQLPELASKPLGLSQETARLMRETGEIVIEVAQAIDPAGPNGAGITREERESIGNKVSIAIRHLVALEAALEK